MANRRITELTALTTPADADYLVIVDDVAGNPDTRYITASDLAQYMAEYQPTVSTFTAADTTPSVSGGRVFLTDTGTLNIDDFDDGVAGQQIVVISKGAVTFRVTAADLNGGTTDIVTADGDVTHWVCEDGGAWRLVGYMDDSVDNSGGA